MPLIAVITLLASDRGLFGAVPATIASGVTLPKVCKSRFDITSKKEDDGYKGLTLIR